MDAQNGSDPNLEQTRQDWQERLAGYVLGDLSSEEKVQVQQYLNEFPEAQADVRALQETLNLLPLSLPDSFPPADLRGRVLRSAQQSDPNQQSAPGLPTLVATAPVPPPPPGSGSRSQPRSQHHRRSWGVGLGSIAAASVIAILGLQNHRLQQELNLARRQHENVLKIVQTRLDEAEGERDRYQSMIAMLRQPNNRLLSMGSTSINRDAYTEPSSGSLVIAPHTSWAVLSLQNLPAPPPKKAYQLWAVVNGEKVYCTEFKPNADGEVLIEIPAGEWSETTMVVISLEEEGKIPDQAGEMVMNSSAI